LNFILKDAPWKALQNLCKQISIAKQKSLRNIFLLYSNTMGSSIIMNVIHFEYELCHQNKSVSICSDIFCRAFHTASFKKNSRFYHLSMLRYVWNKKNVGNILIHPASYFVDFKNFIITFSCLYFYYYKERCYSIIYHLKGGHKYSKLI